ncbi:MAG: transcriptional regulator [Clostridiales bacterium]|jgi:DNA-binding MurR/RpiR family transcriptional regulator|nr:transcriptional regulator [Clostridiales bacterium]
MVQNNGSMLWKSRIEASWKLFTNAEKNIAEYILDNQTKVHGKSARELAEMTATSAATLVRFCKTIGFEGFTDFLNSIERGLLMSDSYLLNIELMDSVSVTKQKVLRFNIGILNDLISYSNERELEEAADLLSNANRVIVTGEGGSGCTARIAYGIFLQLGMSCEFIDDPYFGNLVLSKLEKGDVVFTVSNSGCAESTLRNVQLAKSTGATVIGLVGMPNTLISQYLDLVLCTSVVKHEYIGDTLIASISEVGILSVLHSIIMLKSDSSKLLSEQSFSKLIDDKLIKAR